MIITIDTTQPIGSLELSVITTLLDRLDQPTAEPKARKTKPKADPVKEPEPKVEAEPEPAEPEPELMPEPEPSAPTVSREDVIKKATELLGDGQAAKIKAALETAGGAARVSELTDDQLPAFMAALEG